MAVVLHGRVIVVTWTPDGVSDYECEKAFRLVSEQPVCLLVFRLGDHLHVGIPAIHFTQKAVGMAILFHNLNTYFFCNTYFF